MHLEHDIYTVLLKDVWGSETRFWEEGVFIEWLQPLNYGMSHFASLLVSFEVQASERTHMHRLIRQGVRVPVHSRTLPPVCVYHQCSKL